MKIFLRLVAEYDIPGLYPSITSLVVVCPSTFIIHHSSFNIQHSTAAGMEAAAGGRRGLGFCWRGEAEARRPHSAFAKPAPADSATAYSPMARLSVTAALKNK